MDDAHRDVMAVVVLLIFMSTFLSQPETPSVNVQLSKHAIESRTTAAGNSKYEPLSLGRVLNHWSVRFFGVVSRIPSARCLRSALAEGLALHDE